MRLASLSPVTTCSEWSHSNFTLNRTIRKANNMEIRLQSFPIGAVELRRFWFIWSVAYYPRYRPFLGVSSVPLVVKHFLNKQSAFAMYVLFCESCREGKPDARISQ
jgi:hypothetical protein